MNSLPYEYVMDWDRYGKKGEPCRMLSGNGNLVQIVFEDGTTGLISRRAIRRAKTSEKKVIAVNDADGHILAASSTPSAGE